MFLRAILSPLLVIASTAGAYPKTWANYAFANVEEATRQSNAAVAPLINKYPELHHRLLQRRNTQWELAKYFSGPAIDFLSRYDSVLIQLRGELGPTVSGSDFNRTLREVLKSELDSMHERARDINLALAVVLGRLNSIEHSDKKIQVPAWYAKLPAWSWQNYETTLNVNFVRQYRRPSQYRYCARSSTSVGLEFQKRREKINAGANAEIPFLLHEEFRLAEGQLPNFPAFKEAIGEFNKKGRELFLLKCSSNDLERLLKEAESGSTGGVVADSVCREFIREPIRRLLDRRSAELHSILRRFDEVSERTNELETFAARFIVDTFATAGTVYGKFIYTERDSGLKARNPAFRAFYEKPQAIAKDEQTRAAVKNYLVVTPVFCGDTALLADWVSGTEGLEKVRWPPPGDKRVVNAHLTAKIPIDNILSGKKEAEKPFAAYLKETSPANK